MTGDYKPPNWIRERIFSYASGVSAVGLEALVARKVFSTTVDRKGYWLLCLANAICLTVAIYVSLFYANAHPPVE